ncbi:MAG TPA: hypothetical protein VJN71_09170 [Nitrososphaerales archaeon]|nr:hypothetical protein [Nitrososphaerales archaeon]
MKSGSKILVIAAYALISIAAFLLHSKLLDSPQCLLIPLSQQGQTQPNIVYYNGLESLTAYLIGYGTVTPQGCSNQF